MAEAKKEPKPRIPTSSHPYKRTGAHQQAPANGNSRLAKQFIPETKTFREKQGFLGLKMRDDKRSLTEKLRDGIKWMNEKFVITFKHRSECVDQHEYECLMVTHAAISDFTVQAFIFSLFSLVEELPYVNHHFNPARYAEKEFTDEKKREEFKAVIEDLEKVFVQTKKDLKKYIENDAYFLNAQTRSHTIWFLEHFFKTDIEEPDAPTSGKVVFEVQVPDPIPQEVLNAMGNK